MNFLNKKFLLLILLLALSIGAPKIAFAFDKPEFIDLPSQKSLDLGTSIEFVVKTSIGTKTVLFCESETGAKTTYCGVSGLDAFYPLKMELSGGEYTFTWDTKTHPVNPGSFNFNFTVFNDDAPTNDKSTEVKGKVIIEVKTPDSLKAFVESKCKDYLPSGALTHCIGLTSKEKGVCEASSPTKCWFRDSDSLCIPDPEYCDVGFCEDAGVDLECLEVSDCDTSKSVEIEKIFAEEITVPDTKLSSDKTYIEGGKDFCKYKPACCFPKADAPDSSPDSGEEDSASDPSGGYGGKLGKPPGYKGPLPDCVWREDCRDVNDFITLIINWGDNLFALIGSLAFVMFVYGGFMMIFSAGNAEHVKKGQQILVAAVVGLIIAFSAYLLIRFILDALDVSAPYRAIK